MKLEDLFESVETISNDQGYWFIRTDSGTNFENFVDNNFIGIGWNEITATDIINLTREEVKRKIAKKYSYDLNLSMGKSKTTSVYNKILRFNNLKKGDLVVIPSYASSRLAFGIIKDSKIYSESLDLQKCDYIKRRKVEWLTVENITSLDGTYYQIIQSRHAISDIKKYSNYINNVTETLYEQNGYTHFILNVKKANDIDLDSLITLMDSVKKLSKSISEEFNLNESDIPLSIRLNLQSPGRIEFKKFIGKSIIILATIFSSCHNGQIKHVGNKKVDDFIEVHQDTLKKIDKAIKELEIDRDKIDNL